MGGHAPAAGKLAIEIAGRPLLAWTLDLVRQVFHGQLFVVLAPDSLLEPLCLPVRAMPVVANEAARGMAWSLRAGLAAVHAGSPSSGAIVLLGDDPLAALALPELLSAIAADDTRCAYIDRAGPLHPVYLPPGMVGGARPPGLAGTEDRGLRDLVLAAPGARAVATTAPAPQDVDTPADLNRMALLLSAVRM